MKKLSLLLLVSCTFLFISCSKEKTNSSAAVLDGTYTFNGIHANTVATVSISSTGEMMVTTTEYTTTDNKGTVVIKNGKITSTDLGYSISTESKVDYYDNGVLDDTYTAPFEFTLPPTTSTSNFKVIGKDSIYFSGGSMFSGLDQLNGPVSPSGGRFTVNGNQLTLTMLNNDEKNITQSGITMHQVNNVSASVFLVKQ